MLEDPANLFVVDLATVASESAGVPVLVQVVACLFLGCCFEALPSTTPSTEHSTSSGGSIGDDPSSLLNRKSFLSMIDSRIGLSRFTDILKKPLSTRSTTMKDSSMHSYSSFFITPDFRIFYQNQVDAIRAGIFEYYTGTGSGDSSAAMGDAMQQQLIGMQKERIVELEQQIAVLKGQNSTASDSTTTGSSDNNSNNKTTTTSEIETKLREQITQLEETVQLKQTALTAAQEEQNLLKISTDTTITQLQLEFSQLKSHLHIIQNEKNNLIQENLLLKEQYNNTVNSVSSNNNDEIIQLKQNIINEHEENKKLKEIIEQKERKILLLFDEIQSKQPIDNNIENKILNLENRNAKLKQELWEKDLEIEKLIALNTNPNATTSTIVNAINSDGIISDFSEVPLIASPVPADICIQEFRLVSNSTLSLIRTLGLNDSIQEFYILEESLNSEETTLHQRCQAVEELLTQCSDALCQCIGECSDITEGAGLHQLEGDEGSVLRVLDCCRQLKQAVDETTHSVDDSEIEHLRLQVEVLERQLNESERDRIELNDTLIELDTKLSTTQQQLEVFTSEAATVSTSSTVEAQSAWETERTTLQSENNNLQTLLRESTEKVDTLTSSLSEAEDQYRQSIRAIEDLQTQLEGVRSSSNQSTAEIRTELETVRTELMQAEHSVVDLSNQLTLEQKQTAQRLAELTKELTSQFEKEQSASTLKLEQKTAELTAELEAARASLSAQETEHAQVLEQRVAELTADIETLRATATEKEAQHTQCLSELQTMLEQGTTERENMKVAHDAELLKLVDEHKTAQSQWNSEHESVQAKLAAVEALVETGGVENQNLQAELRAVRLAVEQTLAAQQAELDAQSLLAVQYYSTTVLLQSEQSASQSLAIDTQRQREYLEIQLTALTHELTAQSTEITTTTNRIEVLQAELDALHMQYNQEVSALNDKLESERQLSSQYSTELSIVRTKHEEELATQDKNYAELLISNENMTNLYTNSQNEIDNLKQQILTYKNEEYNLHSNITILQEKLQSEELLVTQLRSTYESTSTSNTALKTQEIELKRLSSMINQFSIDLNKKELSLQNITTQLRRKEGEYAGILSTYESIKIENEQLRSENESLNDNNYKNNKIIKDKEREIQSLQCNLQSERVELELLRDKGNSESSSSSRVQDSSSKLNRYDIIIVL